MDNTPNKKEKCFGLKEYKRVHDLVYEYQNGSKAAAEELLEDFSKFFTKYLALIKYGTCDLSYQPTRNFIKLFVHGKKNKKLLNPYLRNSTATMNILSYIIKLIQNLFQNSSPEDITQDLKTVFLIMCLKYKDTKPSFHTYIYKTFHFYAYRYFEKMTKDPVAIGYTYKTHKIKSNEEYVNTSIFDILLDKNSYIDNEQILHDLDLHYIENSNITLKSDNDNNNIYDFNFIDTNWENGLTCDKVFLCLSPSERKILKMWYIDNKTDTEIAKEFGVCRGTINKRRNVAKNKLKENLKRTQ